MRDLYKKYENDTHVLNIRYDNDAESPRAWDNRTKIILFGKYKGLGDEHNFSDPEEVVDALLEEHLQLDEDQIGDLYKAAVEHAPKDRRAQHEYMLAGLSDVLYITPIYIYDHSGVTISTSPFSCSWDSGQAGFAYISKSTISQETIWKDSPEDRHERHKKYETWYEFAEDLVESDITVLDQWVTGDVYGFQLYKKVHCDCCGHTELEDVDSCWGFYGSDIRTNGMLEHIELPLAQLEQLLKSEKTT